MPAPLAPPFTRSMAQVGGMYGQFNTSRYVTASGTLAASATGGIQANFTTAGLVRAVGGGAVTATLGSSQGTASICYRDAFTFTIARSTGDTLITSAVLASVFFGPDQQAVILDPPWAVAAGETLTVTATNLSAASAITIYFAFYLYETR